MSSFWKVFLLIIINIIVSVGSTLAVLYYWENIRKSEAPYELVTVVEEPMEIISTVEEPTSEPTEIITEAQTDEPTIPAPAIRGALISIALIDYPGEAGKEALRIVSNSDNVVALENWTLEDADGNKLTLPNVQLLRKGFFLEVYTASGHNTPYEIYWGLNEAIWSSGETAVIKDQLGQIQATYRIP